VAPTTYRKESIMADYFTNFSVIVKLTEAGRQYARDLAAKASTHRFNDEQLPADFPPDLALVLEGWGFETEPDKDGVWLHSQNGGIDAVCAFQRLLRKFSGPMTAPNRASMLTVVERPLSLPGKSNP
jgi:hypothetical protein